jgi:photosystem II stability/assembly factor-like uncharacterized protein/tetratricopeptide (TPR) repeat protein
MFFGREDVFAWIEQNIAGRYADNTLVTHGQRRVGKTSVLKQLDRRLPRRHVPVFFDFQGRTHTTLDQFLWRLAREIARTLHSRHGVELPRPERDAFSHDPEHFAGPFLAQAREELGDRSLLLVFDEFDSLEDPTAKEMLGQDLIPYFSRMMHGAERVNFIFSIGSSGHKLEHMQADYTEFFRVALYRKISFLEPDQARKLIVEPVRDLMTYEEDAVERIVALTSGHPYFTQLTCHELFAQAQRTDDWHVGLDDVEAILPDVIERGTVNLKFVWDDASDTERYTLATLGLLGRPAAKEEIHTTLREHKVRISEEEVGTALLNLNIKDVLASEHEFTVDLMRLWLQQNRPLERVVEELAEKHPIAVRFSQIGEEYREQGLLDLALENYQSALKAAPDYQPAQLGLAEVHHEARRWQQAVSAYQAVLQADDENVQARMGVSEAYLALGDEARERGNIDAAVEQYQKVLAIYEQHTEARERLAGLCLVQAGEQAGRKRWQEAGETVAHAWGYIPEDLETEARRAAAQLPQPSDVVQFEQALAPLQRALTTMRTQLSQELVARAAKLREQKRFGPAITTLRRAQAYTPEAEHIEQEIAATQETEREAGSERMLAAGERALRAQQWQEAVDTFQRFLALEPEDARVVTKVEEHIAQAQGQLELAEKYRAAQQAMEAKAYKRAIPLLREVLGEDAAYQETSELLAEAEGLRRRERIVGLGRLGIAGAVVAVVALGVWLTRPTSPLMVALGTATPTATPAPAATRTPAPPTATPLPTPVPTAIPLAWSRVSSLQSLPRDIVTAVVADPSDPDVWYVGTENGGIYKTINGGLSWLPVHNGLGRARVDTLAIDPDDPRTLYAGVLLGGVYKTSDGGEHWQTANTGIRLGDIWQETSVVVMDPKDSQRLYYVAGWRMYVSEDGAGSWRELSSESVLQPDCGTLQDIAVHPTESTIFLAVSGEDACEAVYKSTDDGGTWTPVQLEVEGSPTDLWIDESEGSSIIASGQGAQMLHQSSDGGDTWRRVEQSCHALAFYPESPSVAFCANHGGWIAKTTDGGATWQQIGKAGTRAVGDIAISRRDPGTIFLGGEGLYVSTNSGYTWDEISNGLGATRLELRLDPSEGSTLYTEGHSLLYRSLDSGRTWEQLNEQQGRGLAFDPSGGALYRIGTIGAQSVILVSQDGGNRWTQTRLPFDQGFAYGVATHPYDPGVLYVPYDEQEGQTVYVSFDDGTTWQKIEESFDDGPQRLVFDHDQGEIIYGLGRLYSFRSSDKGMNWSRCDYRRGFNAESDSAAVIDPRDSDRIILATRGTGLLLSEDGCASWTSINQGLGSLFVNTVALDPRSPDTVYAGTDGGAYVSNDGGDHWGPVNDGLLGGLVIYSIVVDPQGTVYAATPLGIFTLEAQ